MHLVNLCKKIWQKLQIHGSRDLFYRQIQTTKINQRHFQPRDPRICNFCQFFLHGFIKCITLKSIFVNNLNLAIVWIPLHTMNTTIRNTLFFQNEITFVHPLYFTKVLYNRDMNCLSLSFEQQKLLKLSQCMQKSGCFCLVLVPLENTQYFIHH